MVPSKTEKKTHPSRAPTERLSKRMSFGSAHAISPKLGDGKGLVRLQFSARSLKARPCSSGTTFSRWRCLATPQICMAVQHAHGRRTLVGRPRDAQLGSLLETHGTQDRCQGQIRTHPPSRLPPRLKRGGQEMAGRQHSWLNRATCQSGPVLAPKVLTLHCSQLKFADPTQPGATDGPTLPLTGRKTTVSESAHVNLGFIPSLVIGGVPGLGWNHHFRGHPKKKKQKRTKKKQKETRKRTGHSSGVNIQLPHVDLRGPKPKSFVLGHKTWCRVGRLFFFAVLGAPFFGGWVFYGTKREPTILGAPCP